MAVEAFYDSADEVPEHFADHVVEVERDGKRLLQLDVNGMVPKAKVDEFREQNTRLQTTVEKLERRLDGSLSSAEAAAVKEELAAVRGLLAQTSDEERLAEELEKRTTPISLDDREVRVPRESRPHVESWLKKRQQELDQAASENERLHREIRTERVRGRARQVFLSMEDAKPGAADDVERKVEELFKLDDELQPFLPDEKDPDVPATDDDGNKITIESWLTKVRQEGLDGVSKDDVWWQGPSGPGRTPKPKGSSGSNERQPNTSLDYINRGLEKRKRRGA